MYIWYLYWTNDYDLFTQVHSKSLLFLRWQKVLPKGDIVHNIVSRTPVPRAYLIDKFHRCGRS